MLDHVGIPVSDFEKSKAFYMKVLKPLQDRGDVKVVMDQAVKDWQPAEARRLCEQAIAAQKGAIDAVLARYDAETRQGVVEEYGVSTDGVRQDFDIRKAIQDLDFRPASPQEAVANALEYLRSHPHLLPA